MTTKTVIDHITGVAFVDGKAEVIIEQIGNAEEVSAEIIRMSNNPRLSLQDMIVYLTNVFPDIDFEPIKVGCYFSTQFNKHTLSTIKTKHTCKGYQERLSSYKHKLEDETQYFQALYLKQAIKNIEQRPGFLFRSFVDCGKITKRVLVNDIKIMINADFGWGFSSYFKMDVFYKNKRVPNISLLINRLYLGESVLFHHFGSSGIEYPFWDCAIKFAVNVINHFENTHDFNLWIATDAQALINGLKEIMANPTKYAESYWPSESRGWPNIYWWRILKQWHLDENVELGEWWIRALKIKHAIGTIECLRDYSDSIVPVQEAIDYIVNQKETLLSQFQGINFGKKKAFIEEKIKELNMQLLSTDALTIKTTIKREIDALESELSRVEMAKESMANLKQALETV